MGSLCILYLSLHSKTLKYLIPKNSKCLSFFTNLWMGWVILWIWVGFVLVSCGVDLCWCGSVGFRMVRARWALLSPTWSLILVKATWDYAPCGSRVLREEAKWATAFPSLYLCQVCWHPIGQGKSHGWTNCQPSVASLTSKKFESPRAWLQEGHYRGLSFYSFTFAKTWW